MQDQDLNTPEALFVRLKNKIMLKLNMNVYGLKLLIDKFITQNFPELAQNKPHYTKVNIFQEFCKNKMTVKVFFKFLRILNIKKVVFVVRLTTYNDKEIEVSEEVMLNTSDGVDIETLDSNKSKKQLQTQNT